MIPTRFAPHALALLRIVSAFVFLVHGLQKLFGLFDGRVVPMTSMLGAAGLIEFACGLLILIGAFTRPAAFLASGEMAAAYFIAVPAPEKLSSSGWAKTKRMACGKPIIPAYRSHHDTTIHQRAGGSRHVWRSLHAGAGAGQTGPPRRRHA